MTSVPKILVAGMILGASLLMVAACGGGSEKAKTLQLGGLNVSDHGTKDLGSAGTADLEADDFYFEPTFFKATAGQKLSFKISNGSNTIHNFSVPNAQIDKDIPAKGSVTVDVTVPDTGVLLFLCKYHTGQGMNGEILVGGAAPQAASTTPTVQALKVATNPTLGQILTDPAGRTLYLFKNDVPGSGKSATTGNTAVTWPAYTLPPGQEPAKPAGLTGDLTQITRDDGGKQLTYKGQPLYYYARDTNPGDTNGQGVGNVWFVVNP